MSSSRRDGLYWISAWLPVMIGIAVIVLESTEMMGANYTSGPLRWLYEAILGPVSNASWEMVHHYLRKCGHFVGYGLIGLAWLRAWWMTLPNSRFILDAFLALLGTSLIASLDEYHQSFLWNRGSSPWDVLLDTCGALTLQVVVYTFMRIMKPKRLARVS
jgi:VanZ family protein